VSAVISGVLIHWRKEGPATYYVSDTVSIVTCADLAGSNCRTGLQNVDYAFSICKTRLGRLSYPHNPLDGASSEKTPS
jgi:hypothetical protein